MRRLTQSALFMLSLLSFAGLAAPKADLWPHWQPQAPDQGQSVDHRAFDRFLARYLDATTEPARLAYGEVTAADRKNLDDYINTLQAIRPQTLPQAAQMAYWINLYNAATVRLVVENYPVSSITKIKSGLFSFGPWDRELLTVDGQRLSLNDIEHRILRPIFQDPRIHYAVNCASIGCPSLAAQAYTAENLESLLENAARTYVNHPRGVRIDGDRLIVSSIYVWFKDDFGGDDASVIAHLQRYASTDLKRGLARHNRITKHEYDWSLNDHEH